MTVELLEGRERELHEEIDPITVGFSAMLEMQFLGQEKIFEIMWPILKVLRTYDPKLWVRESQVVSNALQGVGPDMRAGLKQVVPKMLEQLPIENKARQVVDGIVFGRDFDFSVTDDPWGLAEKLDRTIEKGQAYPHWKVNRLQPKTFSQDKGVSTWIFCGQTIEVSEELRRLYGYGAGDVFVPVAEISYGRVDSGEKILNIEVKAYRRAEKTKEANESGELSLIIPILRTQVMEKVIKEESNAKVNPYNIVSTDSVHAEAGKGPSVIVWHPAIHQGEKRVPRWRGNWRTFLTLRDNLWPRQIPFLAYRRGDGMLRPWTVDPAFPVAQRLVFDKESLERVILGQQRILRSENTAIWSLMQLPGVVHPLYLPMPHGLEDWFTLDSDQLEVLAAPVRLEGLEQLKDPVEMAFVLSRLLFKVVEGEWLLMLSKKGRERIKNEHERFKLPAIEDAQIQEISDVIYEQFMSNGTESSAAEIFLQELTRGYKGGYNESVWKLQRIATNMLVALGNNDARAWKYITSLELNKLFPALVHLSKRDCESILWDEIFDTDEVCARLAGSSSLIDSHAWVFNGENQTEIAYDTIMANLTYIGEFPDDFARDHFEFGWKRMARVLRKYVAAELAAIENDVEFLVRVFDMAPEIEWPKERLDFANHDPD